MKFDLHDPLRLKGRRRCKRVVSILAIGAISLSLSVVDTQASVHRQERRFVATKHNTYGFDNKIYLAVTVFLVSGTSYPVPVDWDSINNTVECIGAGGASRGGFAGSPGSGGGGGGGGAYAMKASVFLPPGGSIQYQIGAGGAPNSGDGTNTWFNGPSLALSSCGANAGGGAGTGSIGGGPGGTASASVGDLAYNGGKGGNGGVFSGTAGGAGGGGGGAGGPNGAGNPGTNGGVGSTGGTGGSGGNGSGGAGGTGGAGTGGAGGNGSEFDPTHGSGGGGGAGAGGTGAGASGSAGAIGGNYGGGGGGGGGAGQSGPTTGGGRAGIQGLIVLTYTPVTAIDTVFNMDFNLVYNRKIMKIVGY